LSDAVGHSEGGEAARLGDTDQAVLAAVGGEGDFRELGSFTGAGIATDDDNTVIGDSLRDLMAMGTDGEFIRKVEWWSCVWMRHRIK